jgi:hypothetical protein
MASNFSCIHNMGRAGGHIVLMSKREIVFSIKVLELLVYNKLMAINRKNRRLPITDTGGRPQPVVFR